VDFQGIDMSKEGDCQSLAALMNIHCTDKLFAHHYEDEYERHFAPIRAKPLNILEIGVGGYSHPTCGGESLKVWRDYFQSATIVGIDIKEKMLDFGERVIIRQCDQSNAKELESLNSQDGPFDIIIDDGSHVQEHIMISFRTLWPMLKLGGIYVIEDLATAYDPDHGGSPEKPLAILLICSLINGLHHQFWKVLKPGECDPTSIKSVHVSKELVFIYKA
jgi:2-polyprenyl-3-methyl-5-hydroxy-6-metoxy-1,4-benzoquinol methylase